MSVLATAALAIVTQNAVALRAAPREAAPQQATLWQGEVLELRGERGDYLGVYDHRLGRGGYVRAAQVRAIGGAPGDRATLNGRAEAGCEWLRSSAKRSGDFDGSRFDRCR